MMAKKLWYYQRRDDSKRMKTSNETVNDNKLAIVVIHKANNRS